MAHVIIDRRNNNGRSSVNRQRFLRRINNQVKAAVKKAIADGRIGDVITGDTKEVNIPVKDLGEPNFSYGKGGVNERVYPGNKDFTPGDRINRPKQGGGQGGGKGEASPDGEGTDEFTFHLTKEEFLDLFFEDLELPDLVKKNINVTKEYQHKRAGFSVDGSPNRLNVLRSMKQSKARKFALITPKKKKLKKLLKEEEELNTTIASRLARGEAADIEKMRLEEVKKEIEILKRKIKAIPFVDEYDLRYNHWRREAVPTTQAVMFCVMDVSGSMGEWEKEMSKRFFMLLYMFLFKNYETVELVFIRHHTEAREVDEDEFFYSRETGGTLVSPALELMYNIIQERYSLNEWNVYACQASDGDNWREDIKTTMECLRKKILPLVQYYAYVEVNGSSNPGDLWPFYEDLKHEPNFDMANIKTAKDIYPVFRGLFERKN